jgi:hypothetical protein
VNFPVIQNNSGLFALARDGIIAGMNDKARSVLLREYSSIPVFGGRAHLTPVMHHCIRYEFKEIFPKIARGESSCDCRDELIGDKSSGGLAHRWGLHRRSIERIVAPISTVLSSCAAELS